MTDTTEYTIYAVARTRDHIDKLYQIAGLAQVGAAATDSALNIDHLEAAQCNLFEVMHRLSCEALECAEGERRKLEKLEAEEASTSDDTDRYSE